MYDFGTFGSPVPFEYTGWMDEVMSWKQTCYLHAGMMNPTPTYRLTGPDALKLLSHVCVNSFETFSTGTARHAIMCNEHGNIVAHGMCLRIGDEEFLTYWLGTYLSYFVERGDFDVTGEDITGQVFMFQVAGPRSLEVLETAAGEDLHDIRFIRHRPSRIVTADGDVDVTILRIGMAGTLGYEVHGMVQDAHRVYSALLAAGEPFGIRRLGALAYALNHSENGFPQTDYHIPNAWAEDPDLLAYARSVPGMEGFVEPTLRGSMGPDMSRRYCTPLDLGWGHMVKFDHDFIGRAVLERDAAAPRRQMVTLVWNPEDILEIIGSLFEGGETYRLMDVPIDPVFSSADFTVFNDEVSKDGRVVGMTMGRMYSYHYRAMISLCPIAVEHAEIGTEVTVLWGDPGTRQKEIRATVARFPYLDLERNEKIDVETIPRIHQAQPAG